MKLLIALALAAAPFALAMAPYYVPSTDDPTPATFEHARDPEGGAWLATGNLMQFGPDLWNKAKECYATGHYMPSYDPEAGWDWPDLHGKPCDEFPAL